MDKNELKNNFCPFILDMDIDIILPKEKRTSIQKSFSYLRKKLHIKLSRKTYMDSILKKCKVRFFKAIYDCLKKCTKKSIIPRLPQKFIINISIEINKNIFEKSLQELYQDFDFSPLNIDKYIEEGKCLKGKEEYFRYICTSKISELYILYTKSKRYKSDVEYIKNYLGIKMAILYKFVSKNFVNYFILTKPHYLKNKDIKNKNNSGSNVITNKIINKNIIDYNKLNSNIKDYKKTNACHISINNNNSEQNNNYDSNINNNVYLNAN